MNTYKMKISTPGRLHESMATFCLLIVIAAFYSTSAVAQSAQTLTAIDKLLLERYPADRPGAVALVAKDGKVIFRKGYGKASLNPQADITPKSIFRIGSITKQFTAVAILQLVQAGKLKLEDDITIYLPDYPTQGKKITVENLLTHTSGIQSYTSLIELKSGKGSYMATADRMNLFKNQPLEFSPGERYQYSNSGYFLLGAIIEKVTGLKYGEYLKKNIFAPLQMKSTYYEGKEIEKDKITKGYSKGKDGYLVADFIDSSMPFAAGALFSSVDDLWKWNKAIFSYKVLPKEFIEKAWQSGRLPSGMETGYGYGWSLSRLDDINVIDHGGQIEGYLGYLLFIPEKKLFVTVLTNDWYSSAPGDAYDIARLVINQPVVDPPAIVLGDTALNEYVGTFEFKSKILCPITREGHGLYVQWPGGEKGALIPFRVDEFAIKGTRERLKFVRDQNSKIIGVSHAGDWINEIALKTNQQLEAEKVAIDLDVAKFDEYVGTYELAPNYKITVWREDKKFIGQATGSDPYEIFPESESKFFLKAANAQVEFIRDNQGKVTGLTLNMNGRSTPGRKIQ
jgi:CubicO group peptidase (beta-lactamase class C family)